MIDRFQYNTVAFPFFVWTFGLLDSLTMTINHGNNAYETLFQKPLSHHVSHSHSHYYTVLTHFFTFCNNTLHHLLQTLTPGKQASRPARPRRPRWLETPSTCCTEAAFLFSCYLSPYFLPLLQRHFSISLLFLVSIPILKLLFKSFKGSICLRAFKHYRFLFLKLH